MADASRPATAPSKAAFHMEDPICGMEVNPDVATRAGLMSNFHGAPFFFCSPACKQAFDADPRGAVTRAPAERAMPVQAHEGALDQGGQGEHEEIQPPMQETAPQPMTQPQPMPGQQGRMPVQAREPMPGPMPAAGHGEGHGGAAGAGEKAVDPVCRMEVDTDQARAAGLATEHNGTTWYFCTPECKREFDADPAVYLPMVR